jgi:hypothetical protein
VIAQSRSAPHLRPLRDRMSMSFHLIASFGAVSGHPAVRVVMCRIPQSRSGSTPKGVLTTTARSAPGEPVAGPGVKWTVCDLLPRGPMLDLTPGRWGRLR